MWADIAAFLKANASETLIISIIGTILVWMYKQFKSMIDEKQQSELMTIQLKQGLFTKLELAIANVLHLDNDVSKQQMYALLGECGPHLTSEQRAVIRDYYKQFNPLFLHTLQALIISEVDKLNRKLEKISEDEGSGEWLIYIKRLYAPIWPILLFAIIILYVLFFIQLIRQGTTLWVQICILITGVNLFISVTLLVSMIYFFVKRELGKQAVISWCMFAMIIVSPALIFVVNRFDMSIVVSGIQILGFIMITRIKRPSEIIRP